MHIYNLHFVSFILFYFTLTMDKRCCIVLYCMVDISYVKFSVGPDFLFDIVVLYSISVRRVHQE